MCVPPLNIIHKINETSEYTRVETDASCTIPQSRESFLANRKTHDAILLHAVKKFLYLVDIPDDSLVIPIFRSAEAEEAERLWL
jgi:hypothetical protein